MSTYERMDREAARRDEQVLAHAAHAIRVFFESVGDRLPLFDPFERDPATLPSDELGDEIRAALADRDWIEGYRLGRGDVQRESAGVSPLGPGATPDPKDGWSPSSIRRDAYALGRVDAANA